MRETSTVWTPLRQAYDWVHQIATVLDNTEQLPATTLQQQLQQVLQTMEKQQDQLGDLATGVTHFLKVTQSYAAGLFHCYTVPDLPRTNNDLEQVFGQLRHHQRRVTGRKVAPASLVLRGPVRLVAAIASRCQRFDADDFANASRDTWKTLRSELRQHQLKRIQQRHFRRDPDAFLAALEAQFLQLTLPH